MPSLATIATVAAGAGRVPPVKPTLQYLSPGQFKISDDTYSASLIYGLSVNSGTINRSSQIITLSSANALCTVTAINPKLGSSSSTFERRSASYSCRTVTTGSCQTCCNTVGGCSCSPPLPDGGPCPPGTSPNGQCGCGGGTPCMAGTVPYVECVSCNCTSSSYQVCDVLISQPGFTWTGSEWYKVT